MSQGVAGVLDGVDQAPEEGVVVVLLLRRWGRRGLRRRGALGLLECGCDRRLGRHHRLARGARARPAGRKRPGLLEGGGDLRHPPVDLQAAARVALQVVLDAGDGVAELWPARPVGVEDPPQP
jgi:hypothetical protein